MDTRWILCPICGNKTRDRIRVDAVKKLSSLPVIFFLSKWTVKLKRTTLKDSKNCENTGEIFCYHNYQREEAFRIENKTAISIEQVIDYIENHLNEKIDLETIATAVNYSKYHLHRMFTETVGLTIHDYVQRRQLTEAAKLLVFSDKPIIEIAFICGYESQQSFTTAFTAMYKTSPAQYRDKQEFYPLLLRFVIHNRKLNTTLTKNDIRLATTEDILSWMELLRLVVDGYPVLDETDYLYKLKIFIQNRQALVLKDGDLLIGALAFSIPPCSIEFLGIHPQYRKRGIQKLFLDALLEDYYPEQDICITTYRKGDRADTGYRKELQQLGFAERELLIEFGYPTQRFVLPAKYP